MCCSDLSLVGNLRGCNTCTEKCRVARHLGSNIPHVVASFCQWHTAAWGCSIYLVCYSQNWSELLICIYSRIVYAYRNQPTKSMGMFLHIGTIKERRGRLDLRPLSPCKSFEESNAQNILLSQPSHLASSCTVWKFAGMVQNCIAIRVSSL